VRVVGTADPLGETGDSLAHSGQTQPLPNGRDRHRACPSPTAPAPGAGGPAAGRCVHFGRRSSPASARSRLMGGSPASCVVSVRRYRQAPQPQGRWPPRPAPAPARRRRVRARGPRQRRGAGSGSGAVRARGAGMGRGSRPCRSRCVPVSVLPPLAKPTGVRGIPQASRWMNRPPGASGSSRISASELVPAGGVDHDSGGERSSPSQVWRRGMVSSSATAVLVSENSAIANLPCDHVAFRLLAGPSSGRLNRSRGAGRSWRPGPGSRPGSPPASAAARPGSGGAQSRRPPPPIARPCRAGPRR
jgi:hypothetical protein